MSVNIKELISKNQARWDGMISDPARASPFQKIAVQLTDTTADSRFRTVSNRLVAAGYQPVPWWFIAIVAKREYGGPPIWDKQLGQGDPLDQRSHNVPAGRGPWTGPEAWEKCAFDALALCQPKAALWNDWTAGGVATIFEEYNGLGYAMRGVPSAYVWSGSDQYVSGKYVADHVYRAGTKDVQQGCMPILHAVMELDPSIKFADAPGQIKVGPAPQQPMDGSLVDAVLAEAFENL